MEKGAYKQLSYFWTPAARPGADERLGAEALRFDGDVGNVKSVFLKCGGPNRVLLRQSKDEISHRPTQTSADNSMFLPGDLPGQKVLPLPAGELVFDRPPLTAGRKVIFSL